MLDVLQCHARFKSDMFVMSCATLQVLVDVNAGREQLDEEFVGNCGQYVS
jgi:hypothetical protein